LAKYENIESKEDLSLGTERIKVVCNKCGAHLGHLFADAITRTGLRYCINSCISNFKDNK
jgi:peptide-methionine (R)-S-oxide reductase